MSEHTDPDALDGGPSPSAPTWELSWEPSLGTVEHEALAALLTLGFPTTEAFTRGRSWAGARPELRVTGRLDDRPVAHAGIIRRFLRSPDYGTSTLVGDVGLVAVHPDHAGRRLGTALMSAVATTLVRLGLPYGFLTCARGVRPFYERCGWTALSDRPVRSITVHHRVEHHRHNGMLLPVLSPLSHWPPGPIQRDGQEI